MRTLPPNFYSRFYKVAMALSFLAELLKPFFQSLVLQIFYTFAVLIMFL